MWCFSLVRGSHVGPTTLWDSLECKELAWRERQSDWTKIYPSKHVQLSLISVVYLLYLIIIEIFYCACLLELV